MKNRGSVVLVILAFIGLIAFVELQTMKPAGKPDIVLYNPDFISTDSLVTAKGELRNWGDGKAKEVTLRLSARNEEKQLIGSSEKKLKDVEPDKSIFYTIECSTTAKASSYLVEIVKIE